MTRDEILALRPGRDLDVLVHRMLFGRECVHFTPEPGEFGSDLDGWYEQPQTTVLPQAVPFYSTLVQHAWLVVEHLVGKYRPHNPVKLSCTLQGWCCRLRVSPRLVHVALADSVTLAVCRAALLTVGDG